MANFCIPVVLAEKLKTAAKKGEIDIAAMYEMTSAERNELFQKYVDKATAKQINLGFEKAMVSEQQTALKKWAENTFTGGEVQKARQKDVFEKINELSQQGVLTPDAEKAFLQDLVGEKLGINITAEEGKQIADRSEKLQAMENDLSPFGTHTEEYFVAKREMQNYLESLSPSSNLKVISSIVTRGNMLAQLHSTLMNIWPTTIQGSIEALARRIETFSLGGVNGKYAADYAKFAMKVYDKSKYDITTMLNTDDNTKLVSGEKQVTTQGTGAVRKIGRAYEDIIFSKMHGIPTAIAKAIASADRSNIQSTKIARQEGLKGDAAKARALEIFKDATSIQPKTEEGKAVRSAAIADALYSTNTNKSIYSDTALAIRNVLNTASGDLRYGDNMMPFVMKPANVVGASINASGIGVPIDTLYRMARVIDDIRNGEKINDAVKDRFKGYWKTIVEAGLGISFAFILSKTFKAEDFIGELPVSEKERQLLALHNATPNSVKIGNHWISIDLFGELGAPFIGFMYAKKYGTNLPTSVYNYAKGVVHTAAKIPGISEAYGTLKALQSMTPTGNTKIKDEVTAFSNNAMGFMQSRLMPSLISDLAKMTDPVERATDKNDILAKLKAAIPGWRETLPEKKTVFGDTVKTEPWMSVMVFGSRLKTAQDSPLLQELSRLDQTGNLPSITDVSKTSTRAQSLKDQIGEEKFSAAIENFGSRLKNRLDKAVQNPTYQKMNDEKRSAAIDKIKNEEFDNMLLRNHYKKPPKQ